MNLEEKLKQLPQSAGVYQYFNAQGHLLYIGKAKNLKNRVKSYFKFTPFLAPLEKLSPRIYKMISEVVSIEWIVVEHENDALILENSLIKQLKPKYNILLRDDKTYPYIYIDLNEEFPRFEITRKIIKKQNIKYFGPYSSGAKDILDSIYEVFPLVQKKSCIKSKEACLFFQIKKCLAPCEDRILKDDYKKIVQSALGHIYNKNKIIIKLKQKMEFYSNEFRFEEAMKLRDRIKIIEKSQIKSVVDFANSENLDLFCIVQGVKKAIIVRIFIREGKIASSNYDFIKLDFNDNNYEIDFNEAYKRAIINYYHNDIPVLPKEVIVANELENKDELEKFLAHKLNKILTINFPKNGKKLELIKIAKNNCEELLRVDYAKNTNSVYEDLQNLFMLNTTPQRIEIFDNSHLMGQASVGSMVVWDEKFVKEDYRHYNLEAKNEYEQMSEMLKRRVESFEKNPAPNLWVIDGGQTLLKLAFDILNSCGVNIDVIAISKEKIDFKAHRAKGAAKDILHYKKNEEYQQLKLSSSDQRLQFIQRLRDEAHHFAISFHKKQKRKEDKQISILQLKGIGEAKLRKLLLYFGTFEAIKKANAESLCEVLNQKDATLLYNHFKSNTLD